MTIKNKEFLQTYFASFRDLLDVEDIQDDVINISNLFETCSRENGQVFILGNGGSAGIASHIAIDLSKNAGINARTFSDASEITCLANDYGFENWMTHALRLRMTKNDIVVLISSSGNSQNVIKAARYVKEENVKLVTLTGMSPNNELRKLGDINLWVDSRAYNLIETIHQFWLMSIIDMLIGEDTYGAQRVVTPLSKQSNLAT